MAGDTVELFSCRIFLHTRGDIAVTFNTIVPDDIRVEFFYSYWFRKIAHGKGAAVVPAVDRFDRVFSHNVFGGMTAVAGSGAVMAGSGPAVELLPHDVTVFAGDRIIMQIRDAPRIDECVETQAGKNAQHYRKGNDPGSFPAGEDFQDFCEFHTVPLSAAVDGALPGTNGSAGIGCFT